MQKIAERIVEFMRDFDFYGYQDSKEAWQDDSDVLSLEAERLEDAGYLRSALDYFRQLMEDDAEDLTSGQKDDLEYITENLALRLADAGADL